MKDYWKSFLSWIKDHDRIAAAIAVAVLIVIASLWANVVKACESNSEVYASVLLADNNPYCHHTATVGEFGINLYGGSSRLFGASVQPFIGYQHESCWAEGNDKNTMDAARAGIELSW